MINLLTGLIGLALVVAFLGFMLVWVKAIPLIVIVVVVMLLLAFDLWQSVRGEGGTAR